MAVPWDGATLQIVSLPRCDSEHHALWLCRASAGGIRCSARGYLPLDDVTGAAAVRDALAVVPVLCRSAARRVTRRPISA